MSKNGVMSNTAAQSSSNCRLLALETSGRAGSVALAQVDSASNVSLLDCRELPATERSARSLTPLIGEILQSAGWQPSELTAIGVNIGPGSFTGLRVGITTAKTMAYALGTKIIGINTLAALAEPHVSAESSAGKNIWALLDAQRQERFVARFSANQPISGEDNRVETLRLHETDCFAKFQAGDIVVGPLATAMSTRAGDLTDQIDWQDQQPMADAVARLTAKRLAANEADDLYQLAPQYHRVSAAEENYDSQQKRKSAKS